MADREKVIKGLECCVRTIEDCECADNCPYETQCWDGTMYLDLMRDALALLKAQEPRLMTLKELPINTLVWLERSFRGGQTVVAPIEITGIGHRGISFYFGHEDFRAYNHPSYGWRIWTARPDDETREATPWNS